MVRSRLGLKALGLCALVLGLMAFITSGAAQAEPNARWGYLDSKGELKFFDKILEPETQISELENKTGSLLFTTGGGTKVTILCTSAAFDEGGLLGPEGKVLLFRAHFTGCITFLNGTLSKACEPHTGASIGLILSLKMEGLIKLHELAGGILDTTVLVKPDPNLKGLAVIELGEECSIGESVEVGGELVAWDCKNELSVHKLEHLIEEFPKLHLVTALGQPALIDGTALVKLVESHAGIKWAGLPG
jgi:hypothetical protein